VLADEPFIEARLLIGAGRLDQADENEPWHGLPPVIGRRLQLGAN
jgi:hypothetical protein